MDSTQILKGCSIGLSILIILLVIFIIAFIMIVKNKITDISKTFESIVNKFEGSLNQVNNSFEDIENRLNKVSRNIDNMRCNLKDYEQKVTSTQLSSDVVKSLLDKQMTGEQLDSYTLEEIKDLSNIDYSDNYIKNIIGNNELRNIDIALTKVQKLFKHIFKHKQDTTTTQNHQLNKDYTFIPSEKMKIYNMDITTNAIEQQEIKEKS